MKKELESYLLRRERGFLSTVNKHGVPTVIPICFVYLRGKLYTPIDSKPKRTTRLARLKNIASNGRAAFIVDNYSENWEKLSYLLLHCGAALVDDAGEERLAKESLLMKYPQYRTLKLDRAKIIVLTVKRVKFWAFRP